jgi:hypothetical protein
MKCVNPNCGNPAPIEGHFCAECEGEITKTLVRIIRELRAFYCDASDVADAEFNIIVQKIGGEKWEPTRS